MRITGGTLSGRTVHCPPGIIRPAMDRMRESFFSILGELNGLSFLDLFSGSGLMAIEAFSRGAYPVRSVEKDAGKRELLIKNLSMADRRIDLSLMPVERFIKAWREAYDLIFLDPPFDYPYKTQLLSRILDSKIVKPDSKVFIHYPEEDRLPEIIHSEKAAADSTAAGVTISPIPANPAASDPESMATPATPANSAEIASGLSLILDDRRVYGRSIVHFYKISGLAEHE